jgi:signal transduction histidine kinase/CheY-like chemotaxis protein/putative methionine-R-sulfoxide reductase with GAF domain
MPGEKILIVDDSKENVEFIVDYVLEPNGYIPGIALDGAEGLRKAREERPDLILLDMNMPKMTGIEVLEALRNEGQHIPVILMTFHGSETLAVTAFRQGVKDYILKPFQLEEMLGAIERALTEVRLRRERDDLMERLVNANRMLEQHVKELNTLFGIGKSVTALLELDKLLARLVEAAVFLTGAEEGSFLLVDEETDELYMVAAQGIDKRMARSFRIRVEDSLAGEVIKTGEPIMLDGKESQRIKTAYLVKSLIYVPLKVNNRVSGVLGVDNRQTDQSFTKHDLRLLSVLAGYAAIALENARLFAEVESERTKLATVLGSTEEPVLVTTGHDDRIVLANAAARRAFGLDASVVEGHPLAQLIDNEELVDFVTGAPETGLAQKGEIPVGDGRTLYATLTPIPDVGRAVIMQDVTHFKELDQMKTEFVSTVSHDLRSPLTSILGYAQMLKTVGPLEEKQEVFVERIMAGVNQITELINDLLDLGRIEAGVGMEMTTCDISTIAEKVAKEFKDTAASKSQELVYYGPAEPALVLGNELRLRQVISNLIGNAIKYTDEAGKIYLVVHLEDSNVLLSVKDNGMGIPVGDLPYVFDKFYRVESDETADIRGTGLGLSICRSVVEKHKGRIWVESVVGKGSVFQVALPALVQNPPVDDRQRAPEATLQAT